MATYQDALLAFNTSDGIEKEVFGFKQEIGSIIGNFPSIHSKAHLTVCYIPYKEEYYINTIISFLENRFSDIPPVELNIRGFNYFSQGNNTKTIYAAIESSNSIKMWFNELNKHIKIKSTFTPHVTIARSTDDERHRLLWPKFKNLEFNDSFTPTGITVLVRDSLDTSSTYQFNKFLKFKM